MGQKQGKEGAPPAKGAKGGSNEKKNNNVTAKPRPSAPTSTLLLIISFHSLSLQLFIVLISAHN